ncbi:hypothetical protein [Psychrobacter sp. JB385]|uniref:hypothetical protein n=1 Tax=Psychrobacter sp. JB385 TaxID=1434841 RepID=UPI000B34AB73|nr:hypothetical protein [Psychrobacter sp. JB385]
MSAAFGWIAVSCKDPFNDNMKNVVVPTLSEVYEYYLSHKSGLKPSTIATYNRQILGKLAEWLDKSMNDIMQSNVTEKHLALTKLSPSQANATFRALNAVWNFSRLSFLINLNSLLLSQVSLRH